MAGRYKEAEEHICRGWKALPSAELGVGVEPFWDVWAVTHFEAERLVSETSLFPNGFAFDGAAAACSYQGATLIDHPGA